MKHYFQTFTVTVASPAVFTCAEHELSIGDRLVFETTGALPTGLETDTEYYVIRNSMTVDTFQVSTYDTYDGTGDPVNTSGTQSGTQTFLKVNKDKITMVSTPFR
jgi:hypothetical protein